MSIDIDENLINYISDGEPQSQAVFNRPTQDLIEQLRLYEGGVGEQGPQGEQGTPGQSAYDLWISLGNAGTEEEFLNSLKGGVGEQGPQGQQGPQGPQGPAGPTNPQSNTVLGGVYAVLKNGDELHISTVGPIT